jgi:transketolase C-terminal domain/subunit
MKNVSIRETFGECLVELGKEYQNIVVLDDDLASSTKCNYFCEAFPDRFFEVGIAEQNMMGIAVHMSTLKPLDEDRLKKCAAETGAIVTAENHSIIGGLGSAVAEVLVENEPVPMARVGIRDVFGESGPDRDLYLKYGLTSDAIAHEVKKVVARKGLFNKRI